VQGEHRAVLHQDKSIYKQLNKAQEEEQVTMAETEPETPQEKSPVFPEHFIQSLTHEERGQSPERTSSAFDHDPGVGPSLSQKMAALLEETPPFVLHEKKAPLRGVYKNQHGEYFPFEGLLKGETLEHAPIAVTTSLGHVQKRLQAQGQYGIYLASLRHEGQAQEILATLKDMLVSLSLAYEPHIQKLDLGRERGRVYVIYLGPMAGQKANEIVGLLKKQGIFCDKRPL
jgi:hypothetical protein